MSTLSTRGRLVRADRAGFTALEIVVVLMIAAIMTGIAIPRFTRFAARQDARNARDSFVLLAKRTRAAAVQRGEVYRVEIDPVADRAWVVSGRSGSGDTVEVMNYWRDSHVNVETSVEAIVSLCYSPRGYAVGSCTTVDNTPDTVSFRRDEYVRSVRVRPLGQVDAW